MDSSSQDRSLPASPRKLQKARGDGQVARSRDLSNLAVLGGGALSLLWLAPPMFERLAAQVARQLTFSGHTLRDPQLMLSRLGEMTSLGLLACVIFALIVTLIAILSSLALGGWVASLKPIMPDFSRLDPLAGFGRFFSLDKGTEVLKMSFIAGMLLVVGFSYLSNALTTLGSLVLQPSTQAIEHLAGWLSTGMGQMLLVLLLVALVDVPLQAYLHRSRLKMSHEELKQENKESEGNPQVKNRRRQRQREIAHAGSIKAVPKADFVLMNPTHYAVAVQYDDSRMAAPRVISKGADLLAFRIRDLAVQHAIVVLQAPALARALYANAELDADIPASLYTAVAQVLAYIYRLKAALHGDGPMPAAPPLPEVPPELDPLHKSVLGTAPS